MAESLIFGFNIGSTEPIDSRFTFADQAARLGLNEHAAYDGLIAYQEDNEQVYVLIDSSDPSDASNWEDFTHGVTNTGFLTDFETNLADSSVEAFGDSANNVMASPGNNQVTDAAGVVIGLNNTVRGFGLVYGAGNNLYGGTVPAEAYGVVVGSANIVGDVDNTDIAGPGILISSNSDIQGDRNFIIGNLVHAQQGTNDNVIIGQNVDVDGVVSNIVAVGRVNEVYSTTRSLVYGSENTIGAGTTTETITVATADQVQLAANPSTIISLTVNATALNVRELSSLTLTNDVVSGFTAAVGATVVVRYTTYIAGPIGVFGLNTRAHGDATGLIAVFAGGSDIGAEDNPVNNVTAAGAIINIQDSRNVALGQNITITQGSQDNLVVGRFSEVNSDSDHSVVFGTDILATASSTVLIGTSFPRSSIDEDGITLDRTGDVQTFETTNYVGTITTLSIGGTALDATQIASVTISANGKLLTVPLAADDGIDATDGDAVVINFSGRVVTRATGEEAIAVGPGAQATAGGALAVGLEAEADSSGNVAFGRRARATGLDSLAFGSGASATAQYGLAIGSLADAAASRATAIGSNSDVEGVEGLGLGDSTVVSSAAAGGIAIGYNSTVTATEGLAIGRNVDVSGDNSFSIMGGDVSADNTGVIGASGITLEIPGELYVTGELLVDSAPVTLRDTGEAAEYFALRNENPADNSIIASFVGQQTVTINNVETESQAVGAFSIRSAKSTDAQSGEILLSTTGYDRTGSGSITNRFHLIVNHDDGVTIDSEIKFTGLGNDAIASDLDGILFKNSSTNRIVNADISGSPSNGQALRWNATDTDFEWFTPTSAQDAVTLAGEDYLSITDQVITANEIDLTDNVTGTLPISSGGTGATSASAARTALGVDASGTDNSTNVTLSGEDYLTISGQAITVNEVDLADNVTGTLPIASGGTGATTAAAARTALDVDQSGTDNSTNVTLTGTPDYITISGQEITRKQIDLTSHVTGVLPTGNFADITTAKITDITAVGSGSIVTDAERTTFDYIPTAGGDSGQVWTSDGSGAGNWADAAGGLTSTETLTAAEDAAVIGRLYILSGDTGFDIQLPSGSLGDQVAFNNQSSATDWTITPATGQRINTQSVDETLVLDNNNAAFFLVYTDAANGWAVLGADGAGFGGGGSGSLKVNGSDVSSPNLVGLSAADDADGTNEIVFAVSGSDITPSLIDGRVNLARLQIGDPAAGLSDNTSYIYGVRARNTHTGYTLSGIATDSVTLPASGTSMLLVVNNQQLNLTITYDLPDGITTVDELWNDIADNRFDHFQANNYLLEYTAGTNTFAIAGYKETYNAIDNIVSFVIGNNDTQTTLFSVFGNSATGVNVTGATYTESGVVTDTHWEQFTPIDHLSQLDGITLTSPDEFQVLRYDGSNFVNDDILDIFTGDRRITTTQILPSTIVNGDLADQTIEPAKINIPLEVQQDETTEYYGFQHIKAVDSFQIDVDYETGTFTEITELVLEFSGHANAGNLGQSYVVPLGAGVTIPADDTDALMNAINNSTNDPDGTTYGHWTVTTDTSAGDGTGTVNITGYLENGDNQNNFNNVFRIVSGQGVQNPINLATVSVSGNGADNASESGLFEDGTGIGSEHQSLTRTDIVRLPIHEQLQDDEDINFTGDNTFDIDNGSFTFREGTNDTRGFVLDAEADQQTNASVYFQGALEYGNPLVYDLTNNNIGATRLAYECFDAVERWGRFFNEFGLSYINRYTSTQASLEGYAAGKVGLLLYRSPITNTHFAGKVFYYDSDGRLSRQFLYYAFGVSFTNTDFDLDGAAANSTAIPTADGNDYKAETGSWQPFVTDGDFTVVLVGVKNFLRNSAGQVINIETFTPERGSSV